MEALISEVVSDFFGREVRKVVGLYGDASYRRYFRVFLDDGTFIAMKMPEGASSVSEEITNYEGELGELPYINVARYLSSIGANVPKVISPLLRCGVLILEDLGDVLFYALADSAKGSGSSDRLAHIYLEAVGLLAWLKDRAVPSDGCIAFKRSFDERLLNWEFYHFLEYGVEARFGIEVPRTTKEEFVRITRLISSEISRMDYIFTHRDFQSRNLMQKDGRLYMLDFQDALLGPEVYDLVSLLRDSYVVLDSELVERLIREYASFRNLDPERIREEFYLITIQRKLKDAGRFVYIEKVKGNPAYLRYIAPSLLYVKDALEKVPRYSPLKGLLLDLLPEWRNDGVDK